MALRSKNYRGGPRGGVLRNWFRQEEREDEVVEEARADGWSVEELRAELSEIGVDADDSYLRMRLDLDDEDEE